MRDKKRLALRQLLVAEINRLVGLWVQISVRHWRYRDFTAREFRLAVIELASAFPIYRTYVQAEAETVGESDAARIREAVQLARRGARLDATLFDFLADLLLLKLRGPLEADFVMRFQQLTGPAMAKGAEDTACYCYNRLISLNEVGDDPGRFGLSVDEFHAASVQAHAHWPDSMIATATHDTKHGEDFRARLSLLSEMPQVWSSAVARWSAMNERYRSKGSPGRNMEYHFYQTAVGAWPLTLERARAYMEKASCEAKTRTTWTERNPAVRQGPGTLHHRRFGRLAVHRGSRSLCGRAGRCGVDQFAGAGSHPAHRPGRAGFLSRHGTVGLEPRRPRQSPAGRFCPAASAAGRGAALDRGRDLAPA